MKWIAAFGIIFIANLSLADEKMKMSFSNDDITKVIEAYAKSSGQKFIIDSAVRGKVTIINKDSVTLEEAFNQLSAALAVNGFAISKQGDLMVIKAARHIQRDLIEVGTEQPSIKPERMYTWVVTLKNISAQQVLSDLRILSSREGEISLHPTSNQLIITDWVTNLNRVGEILKQVDKPVDPATAKIVEAAKKERDLRRKDRATKKEEAPVQN